MNTSKTTYKTSVDYAIANLGENTPADVMEKLKALSVQLEKKSAAGGERKPTKEQEANLELAHVLADYLRENGAQTCAQLRQVVPEFIGMTPQKMTGICKTGERAGLVTSYEVKRQTYWKVVEG